MRLPAKDILDLEELPFEEISFILDTAQFIKETSDRDIEKAQTL